MFIYIMQNTKTNVLGVVPLSVTVALSGVLLPVDMSVITKKKKHDQVPDMFLFVVILLHYTYMRYHRHR